MKDKKPTKEIPDKNLPRLEEGSGKYAEIAAQVYYEVYNYGMER